MIFPLLPFLPIRSLFDSHLEGDICKTCPMDLRLYTNTIVKRGLPVIDR